MPHKFVLGQMVEFNPPRGLDAPPGTYVVTAKLPERDGEFEYHIRHASEQHDRVARESELRGPTDDAREIDTLPRSARCDFARRYCMLRL